MRKKLHFGLFFSDILRLILVVAFYNQENYSKNQKNNYLKNILNILKNMVEDKESFAMMKKVSIFPFVNYKIKRIMYLKEYLNELNEISEILLKM